jgi:hypothetical protein
LPSVKKTEAIPVESVRTVIVVDPLNDAPDDPFGMLSIVNVTSAPTTGFPN